MIVDGEEKFAQERTLREAEIDMAREAHILKQKQELYCKGMPVILWVHFI